MCHAILFVQTVNWINFFLELQSIISEKGKGGAMKLGTNNTDVQKSNRVLVFEKLLKNGPISRIDLARQTGLNKATITNIVQNFIALGIVESIGSINASNGRRVSGLALTVDSVVSIVMRIQADHLIFCTSTLDGKIENYRSEYYFSDTDDPTILIALIIEHISELLSLCRTANKKVLGITIATLGWLFHKNGSYIIKADIAPVLETLNLQELFAQHFPEEFVFIEHDAKVSALAEYDCYCKEENCTPSTMLNIVGDVGFGGGIIINGEVFSGHNGIAGEIGHMGINPLKGSSVPTNGSLRYSGLFENYASPRALQYSIHENLYDFPTSVLTPDSSLEEIYTAYEKGDPLAEFCVNRVARYLAYGLTGIIFILNPEVIVLGDKMIRSDKFFQKFNSYLEIYLPRELFEVTKIRFSAYQDKGVLIGANSALVKHFIKTQKIIDFIILEFQE